MTMACRNDLEAEKILIWNTRLPYKNEPRTSPVFSLMGLEWCFRFVYCDNCGDYHSITLHQMKDGKILQKAKDLKEPFHVKSHMMPITEHNNVEIAERTTIVESTSANIYLWYSGKERDKIFKTLNWLYDCPEVKLACRFYGHPSSTFQLEIRTETLTTSETVSTEEPSDLEYLSRDLSRLLESGQLPDVRLNCGDQTFPAHRSVLAARSEVFAAMFRNRMAESETGGVDVKDFGPDVIRHFLQYLYSGKLSAESGDAVASLFAIANKYAVDSLKRTCTRWIVGGLTEGNCVQYLTVADLHGGEALKKEVVTFICGHPDVMLGEEWAELSEKNPKLALQVHQSFVRSKTEK